MVNSLAKVKKLARFLSYVLGRRPDEFGLLTDPDGFVDVKTLLKAVNEEEGWRYVRIAHLNEIVTTLAPAPIDLIAKRVRAVERSQLPSIKSPENLPKLLFLAIRRRAYATALQKGIRVSDRSRLVLSSDRPMARRIGRRIDNDPVELTIQTTNSISKGVEYQQYGEALYLTTHIPPGTFTGPAPPKERPESTKQKVAVEPTAAKTPGSYFPEFPPIQSPGKKAADARKRKDADWKKARRQERKHKIRQQQ